MTSKEWSLIRNRDGLDMLYQTYLTKYNSLDRKNFEICLRMWLKFCNFDVNELIKRVTDKYNAEFRL